MAKTFEFRGHDEGYKVLFLAEVKEQGIYKGEKCTWVLMKERFCSKKTFKIRLPFLLKEWGNRLIVKKRQADIFIKINDFAEFKI